MKPILFSTPMVQAILEGKKTQTRRIVKPQPEYYNESSFISTCNFKNGNFCFKHKIGERPERFEITDLMKSKYEIGDILWARETWFNDADYGEKPVFVYKASYENFPRGSSPWKPSIFMPKEASRLFLKVTNLRVERLQDISEADAKSEGVIFYGDSDPDQDDYRNYLADDYDDFGVMTAKQSFKTLWDSINGPDSWDTNPWVWVYEFERVDKPNDFI